MIRRARGRERAQLASTARVLESMAVFRTFAVFLGFCLLTGCASRKYMIVFPTGDHIHLYSHGSWGFDSDIWLRADDSFTVAELD